MKNGENESVKKGEIITRLWVTVKMARRRITDLEGWFDRESCSLAGSASGGVSCCADSETSQEKDEAIR